MKFQKCTNSHTHNITSFMQLPTLFLVCLSPFFSFLKPKYFFRFTTHLSTCHSGSILQRPPLSLYYSICLSEWNARNDGHAWAEGNYRSHFPLLVCHMFTMKSRQPCHRNTQNRQYCYIPETSYSWKHRNGFSVSVSSYKA